MQTGYREGITAGKESALQEGFDCGFADVGVPLGHNLGVIRGVASVLVSFLATPSPHIPEQETLTTEAREISSLLSNIRFMDIVPRDLEAEEHARQHLETDDDLGMDEEIAEKRKMEALEDMLENLIAEKSTGQIRRPTTEDLILLKGRLDALCGKLDLSVDLN